jgi:hypothetical protein
MAATDTGKTPAGSVPAARAPIGRAVIWTGLALGTAMTVLTVMHGIRFPGLEVVLSVILTWLLLIIMAVTVTELLRRHHRALARHAARHGKRGALFAARHGRRGALAAGRGARRGGRSAFGYLAQKAAARWENREHRPLMFGRTHPASPPETPAGTAGPPPPSGTARGAGSPPPEGTTTMTDTIINDDTTKAGRRPGGRIRPAHRARHTAARTSGSMPGEWAGVIARAADFEPGDDGELLGWMGDEVSGVAGYAEALIDLYESCTAGIGLDPVAMTALHDVADAAAHAAETMSGARKRFADHYELPREFAGNGGLMPHDGRWVTGDGDA